MKTFIFGLIMASAFGPLSGLPIEKLSFIDCHEPSLDAPSLALTLDDINNPAMQQFFDSMISFAKGEQSDKQKLILVGLAAPQIGKNIRVILVDVKADGKGVVGDLRLYINPEIVEASEETEEWYEGCFSTGLVKGIVRRPRQVTIRALKRDGSEVCETYSGYVARGFQHEIDHLNGVRFPDRVSNQGQLHIVKTEDMYHYRNEQGWRDWKETIPQKDWKVHMQ